MPKDTEYIHTDIVLSDQKQDCDTSSTTTALHVLPNWSQRKNISKLGSTMAERERF